VIGLVAAWLGRLLLAALAALCFIGPPTSVSDQPLNLLAYALGAVFSGVLLGTFRSSQRVGLVLAAVGLWVCFTGFGVIAFVDPAAVIADSQASRRGPELESHLGAYAFGSFFVVLANVPVVLSLWTRSSARRAERRHRELVQELQQRSGELRDEDERRRRQRRTRQSRRKRRARRP
jgi:hypothetical protein